MTEESYILEGFYTAMRKGMIVHKKEKCRTHGGRKLFCGRDLCEGMEHIFT